MFKYYPMKMWPCYKEYLWGGTHLGERYGKANAPTFTAESWELASHKDGVSYVQNGIYGGKTIAELGELDRAGFWGADCKSDTFPLLVKLIDAEKDLSIQVHPSDETADMSKGERGKAEMWYVTDCAPGAFIYYGFRKHISKEEFLQRSADGSICEALNRVPVERGDVFYILPGTVHAIGAGIIVAEIQQNSNTTFRIYDYMRRDARGELRSLHLAQAARVIDLEPFVPEECKVNNSAYFSGFSISQMFSCLYFSAYRFDVHSVATLTCDDASFQHLLFVSGKGLIRCRGKTYPFRQGDSYFLPAVMGDYTVEGECRVLLSRI